MQLKTPCAQQIAVKSGLLLNIVVRLGSYLIQNIKEQTTAVQHQALLSFCGDQLQVGNHKVSSLNSQEFNKKFNVLQIYEHLQMNYFVVNEYWRVDARVWAKILKHKFAAS